MLTRQASGSRAAWRAIAAVLIVAVVVAIYRPWVNQGFDIEDFSEFLAILRAGQSASDRLAALLDYYASHGRWNAAVYSALAIKWELLGEHVVAWQMLRVGQLILVGWLLIVLLERTGVSAGGAFVGASFFLLSSATAAAATRLTLSEPMAVLLLLIGLIVAERYQSANAWRFRAVVLACSAAAIVATKEVLIVLVPAIVMVALCRREGRWGVPARSRRNVVLLLLTAIATLAVAVPILRTYWGASTTAYTAAYAIDHVSFAGIALRAVLAGLPVQHSPGVAVPAPLHPGNVLFVILLCAGVFVAPTRERWWMAALVIVPSIVAGVIYSPWHRFEQFYAQPFLLGSASAVALAVGGGRRFSSPVSRINIGVATLALVFLAVTAANSTTIRLARRGLDNQVVGLIAAEDGEVLVATSSGSSSWQELAATLGRAAGLLTENGRVPDVRAVQCTDIASVVAAGPSGLVVASKECSLDDGVRVTAEFTVIDWLDQEIRVDSLWYTIANESTSGRVSPAGISPR